MSFLHRLPGLPYLGLGVSTEFGAARRPGALDLAALRRAAPSLGAFLEVGLEVERGLDADTLAWAGQGLPTTLHFLDLNLDDPADLDEAWMRGFQQAIAVLRPAWICGDAGLWHFGGRERGQMLLLPPILSDTQAREMARGILALREATGLEVLPENPPGAVYLGDLHLLDFFARLCDYADTGMVLDLAHLAIYQRAMGLPLEAGLDLLPPERIVEVHIAGGRRRRTEGLDWIEDDHGTDVLAETWALADRLIPRAHQLRAIVFECERNPLPAVLPGLRRIHERYLRDRGAAPPPPGPRPPPPAPPPSDGPERSHALQQGLVSLLFDPEIISKLDERLPHLSPAERARLAVIDPRALRLDPLRRGRLLTALLEEAPASALLALGGQPAASLDAYLSSPSFHRAIQEGRPLVLDFLDWLRPRAGGVAVLEGGIARARRQRPPPPGEARACSPELLPMRVPRGSLERYAALRDRLGERPLERLARGAAPPSGLPPEDGEPCWILIDRRQGVGPCSEELGRLLEFAREPRLVQDLHRFLVDHLGIEEPAEVLAGLDEDGSLVPARASAC